MNWYLGVIRNYSDFSGRSRRMEYWMFILINIVVAAFFGVADLVVGTTGVLGGLYALVIIIPWIAVTVRRLHDTGRTGWWLVLILIPFLGVLILFVFMLIDGERGPNAYGPSPKYAAASPGSPAAPSMPPPPPM